MNEPVFHPIDGRADCVSCHATGATGATGMPLSHEGMPSTTCLTCHPPAVEQMASMYGAALPLALIFALGVARLLVGLRRIRPTGSVPATS
jgi:hypothetical protein